MEQFNIPHQKVKEKSVYVLNLDIARIVLISTAVVGIIVVSFLLGMNFVKGGDGAKGLVTRNDLFDGQKELDMLKTNIPDGADEDELSKPLDDKMLAGEKDDKALDRTMLDKKGREDKNAGLKEESSDFLTRDTIAEPAIAEKETRKKSATADPSNDTRLTRADEEDIVVKPARKQPVKNVSSKKKKDARSKVVEVSGEKKEQGRSASAGHYTIQVASFDKRMRAQSEVKALKDMRYDAYVDESTVKGKQYFRVRVGPVASKQKALTLLKGIQEDERYQESYMVRE